MAVVGSRRIKTKRRLSRRILQICIIIVTIIISTLQLFLSTMTTTLSSNVVDQTKQQSPSYTNVVVSSSRQTRTTTATSAEAERYDATTQSGRLLRSMSTIPRYDDLQWANQTRLSTTRGRLYSSFLSQETNINSFKRTHQGIDSNSCFETKSWIRRRLQHLLPTSWTWGTVQCLPALYVVGFEKCGTTNLNIWLSYHPNLTSSWLEGRFFDDERRTLSSGRTTSNSSTLIQQKQYDDDNSNRAEQQYLQAYVETLPTISKSRRDEGWVLEKSPFYSISTYAPKALSALVPSARMIFVTRNPTQRAYSMFLMYTQHFPDTTSAILLRPKSYLVKHLRTGDVRYIADGFRDYHPHGRKYPDLPPKTGGTTFRLYEFDDNSSNNNNVRSDTTRKFVNEEEDDQWVYLSYPPDPEDFHRFIRRAISKFDLSKLFVQRQGRSQRILSGGMYGVYINHWRRYYPPQNLIVVSSEDFFRPRNIFDSMDSLQQMLGLPFFDYRSIVKQNPDTKRFEISGSLGTYLNNRINSYGDKSYPMLPETKKLLDDFYCTSNRQLAVMLGNRSLPVGYSCGNTDP